MATPYGNRGYHQQLGHDGIPAQPGHIETNGQAGSPQEIIGGSQGQEVPNGQEAAYGKTPDGGMDHQMANLSLDGMATHGRKKKKDRHAYHNVEAPAAQWESTAAGVTAHPQYASPNAPASFAPQGTVGHGYVGQPAEAYHGIHSPEQSIQPDTPFAANVQNTSRGRVNPDDIPSIPLLRDSIAQHYLTNHYPTFEHHIPPPAVTPFVAFDQGNASPKFARLTMTNIPSTKEALQATALPLGLILQPLAPLADGELEVPVLDFGDQGPPRCHRCRTYINPFMVFKSGGNKFVCNMCGYGNDVPPEYYCATTPQGARLDREQRPELMRGTVEFIVPKEYWSKKPVGLRTLFLIDVSQESYNKGFVAAFCDAILTALYGPNAQASDDDDDDTTETIRAIPEDARVGFVTYDKDIHFYNMNKLLDGAQMLVMPDIEDPYVPLGEGLFVDPYEARSNIITLLKRLPDLFSQIKNPEPALLGTLKAALAALEGTGGKVVCSLAALPSWGPGGLHMRDDKSQDGGTIDTKLFTTEHPAWKKAAESMAAAGIGVDFFLASPGGGHLDIATIGHVSAQTGGEVFYYPNFIHPRDCPKVMYELNHAVTRTVGYQALMKVRCSTGLQVSSYQGNCVQHTFGGDVEFGTIDDDKALAVLFSHDGKLDSKLDAHFQSALLYTTASGERRVRCSNVIASISDHARECMKFVDQDAVVAIIAKEVGAKMTTTPLKEIRNAISEKTVDILAGYRKISSGSHPPGQLVLPENLKELAMYTLCLLKCRALKGGVEPLDRRVHDMRMLKGFGCLELSLYLYPRMIPIHNLDPTEGFADPATGNLRMPPSLRCTFGKIEEGGVYLVDNGQHALLWLHASTSPNLLSDLFGPEHDSLQSLDPYKTELPVLETHLNCQVRNIMEHLKLNRGSKALTVQLARQGLDGAEYEFARELVEDRNNEAQSYVDWLVWVHRCVQMELTGQRKRDESDNSSISSNFAGLRPPYW